MASDEQDLAAGGASKRRLATEDGRIYVASVAIQKFSHGYQLWGYLQLKVDGKTKNVYIGKVTADTRAESLKIGWSLARQKKVIEKRGWHWISGSAT